MKNIRIIAIISALLMALAVYLYLDTLKKPVEIVRVPVVVAVLEIPEGQVITREMVALKEIPTEAVVKMAAPRLDLIVGYISSANVKPGEQLLTTKVFKAGETKSGMSYAVDKGMRAFTIPVDQVLGVAGFIRPKDHVDIIISTQLAVLLSPEEFKEELERQDEEPTEPPPEASSTPQAESQGEEVSLPVSVIFMQNIKVLATGQIMVADEKNAAVVVDTITLSVTPVQALRLNMCMTGDTSVTSSLRLVLRSPDEPDNPDLVGTMVTNLYDRTYVKILPILGPDAPALTMPPYPTRRPRTTPQATPSPTATPEPAKQLSFTPS